MKNKVDFNVSSPIENLAFRGLTVNAFGTSREPRKEVNRGGELTRVPVRAIRARVDELTALCR